MLYYATPTVVGIDALGGRYQHYLESVLEGADEFHEIGDLILRHATLAATNQDLKDQRNHFGEATEQTRSEHDAVRLLCPLPCPSYSLEVSVVTNLKEAWETCMRTFFYVHVYS